jgi:PAS domain S-box-containing protein
VRTAHSKLLSRIIFIVLALASSGAAAVLILYTRRQVVGLTQEFEDQLAEIRQHREWLNTTLRGIGDGVIACDAQGRVAFMNPVAELLTGWPTQEAKGLQLREIFRIVNEYTREEVESPVDKVRRLGLIVGLANHTILIRKDGSEISIDDSGAPIYGAAGRLSGVVLVFKDVSERRRQEERISESRELFRSVANAIPNIAWTANAEGNCDFFNDVWYEYTGLTAEASMAPDGFLSVVHPDDRERTTEGWAAAVRAGFHFEIEYRLKRKVDETYRWHLGRAVAIRNAEGRVQRWVGTSTDIHVHQVLTEALQKSEAEARARAEELSTILEVTPALIFIAQDRKCEKVSGNQYSYEFLELSPREDTSKSNPELQTFKVMRSGVEVPLDEFPLQLAASTGREVRNAELALVFDDGDAREILGSAAPLFDDSGEVRGAVSVFFDITERKRSEDALRKSEKLAVVGRLAASISHEINNPLEAVTNLFYLISNSFSLEKVHEYSKMAEEELRRVSAVVTQTLRFYRQASRPVPINIEEVLDPVLSLYERRFTSAKIQVAREYGGTSSVTAYEGELRQVFANVIGNAFDAMRGGGAITVRKREAIDWKSGEKGIRVTVVDTGHGMDSITTKKIFEPFFSTKGDTGTGLGLWVTHEIIEKHRGKVSVRSIEGKGTAFSIFFPFNGVSTEHVAQGTHLSNHSA